MYGCGQPTLAGFGAALEKLVGAEKSAPVVWINMRQVWLVVVAMMMVLTKMMTVLVVLIQVQMTGASILLWGVLEPRALFQELNENEMLPAVIVVQAMKSKSALE